MELQRTSFMKCLLSRLFISVILAVLLTVCFQEFRGASQLLKRVHFALLAYISHPTSSFPLGDESSVHYEKLWMSRGEVNLALAYVKNAQSYLEWGSGGSTLTFPPYVKVAVSIEHDAKWCAQMQQRIANDSQLLHINYNCVPVRRGYKGWGWWGPFEEGTYSQFREYVDRIDEVGIERFDVILVDGRARVDAAIKALSYLTEGSVLLLHDYSRVLWPWKKNYTAVLKYYDAVDVFFGDRRQGIGVLKRKKEFRYLEGNRNGVQRILDAKYDIRSGPRKRREVQEDHDPDSG